MNNKGQIKIGFGAVVAFFLIFAALFYFVDSFRTMIVGIGLAIASFVFLFKADIKDERLKFFGFIGILVVGVALIFTGGLLQAIIGGERYVEVPYFATIECQRGIAESTFYSIPTNGQWYSKSTLLPENADSWNIRIDTPDGGTFGTNARVEYYICNSQNFCSNQRFVDVPRTGGTINLGKIDADKHVWVQFQRSTLNIFNVWQGRDGGLLDVTYEPFQLVRDDALRGGRQIVSGVTGCEIPTRDTSWTRRIIEYTGSQNIDEFRGDRNLEPGEIINYVSGNIVGINDGGLQQGGWCLYENGMANIYEIEQITYGSGTEINRVNLDRQIGSAECCDGESYPGDAVCQNGNFIEIEEAECNSRSDCGTLEFFPTGSDTVGRYACVQNQCVIQNERTVECISNSDCLTNELCSRNTFTCEQGSVQTGEGEETTSGTEEREVCEFYEELVTEISTDNGFAYWRVWTPFVDPIITESQVCKTSSLTNILAIVVVVIVLGSVAIITTKPRGKRRKKR